MTSQWVERTWIRTGGYGRFRGEWVKVNSCTNFLTWVDSKLPHLPALIIHELGLGDKEIENQLRLKKSKVT